MKRGKGTNYGDCDDANKIFEIEDGQPFECPTCHEKLKEVDTKGRPINTSNQKKKKRKGGVSPLLIIIGCVVIGLIVAAIIIFAPGKDEEITEPEIMNQPVDSIQAQDQAIPNRNDTLVIKVEGIENTKDSIEKVEDSIVEKAPEQEVASVGEKSAPAPSSSASNHSSKSSSVAPASSSSSAASTHKLSYGTWTGGWSNGQPHGTGTMTYSTSHTIDSRDSKGRVAQPGEYIVGEWDNGHLVQGRWFKNDGSKEAIIIGKAG